MFGTFQPELPDQPIVYGLVDQPEFYSVLRHNTHYFSVLAEKARQCGWGAWLAGPGWLPGGPRLGDTSQLPAVPARGPASRSVR